MFPPFSLSVSISVPVISWDCWVSEPGDARPHGSSCLQAPAVPRAETLGCRISPALIRWEHLITVSSGASLSWMWCQPVSSLICAEFSLVPVLFASLHGNRQAAEKVFTHTLYLITASNQHLFAWRHNSLLLVGTYFLGIVAK